MYSVVLLRKVVGGKAREIPLAAFLTKEGSSSDSRLPAISRIYQFADLNGDGTLEIVTGEVNCKDYRYKVTDVRKDGAFEVVLGSGASPPSGAAGSLPRTAETRTIMVSNSREFLEALGSNRVIEMKPGTYNLSEMDEYLNYAFKRENQAPRYPNLEKDGAVKLAKGIIWSNEPFDGSELVIKGIQNLTIRGLTTGEGAAEIVVDPRYAFVLKFVQCTDITIENLTAGHTTSGNCEGGVFSFTDSSRITINGTNMYGSGTEGLLLKNVSDMTVTGSQIFECTYYIMTITDSRNITFDDCVFRENKQYSMVNVLGENDTITFTCCRFTANYGEMFVVDDLSRVTVANSSFFGNSDSRIPESRNVAFTDCEFD